MTTDSPARYAPRIEFPPYAFLPGRDPHPTRDPRGHSYSEEPEEPSDYFEAEEWRENEEYLYGVDLYNHGYLWEAHEAWEGLWHQAKHDEVQAQHLQGLIQCTAAALKVPLEQPRGLAKLSQAGLGRLEFVIGERGPTYMGVDLIDFVEAFRSFAGSSPGSADERPRLVLND